MGSGGSKHKHPSLRNGQHQTTAADKPLPPGKPYLLAGSPRSDPDVITIKWAPPTYNGGTKITGYLVEHKRTGSPHWVKSTPLLVKHTQLSLSGLEPGMRYQFRISAENCMGRSEPGQISEPFAISYNRDVAVAPVFVKTLMDTVAIENEKVEFLVQVEGIPTPKISWFKDGFEVFSNRRQRVSTDGDQSTFIIHQASFNDEGEIKCSATNKAGHTIAKAYLKLEAPPTIRLPRQYEDGLLFEIGEIIRLKVSITGRPQPIVHWLHNGNELVVNNRIEMANTEKYAMLRILEAKREDRGEYQIKAKNSIGDDIAAFLVTITDRPLPPGKVNVVMTLGRCVTLSWNTPSDDGGCKIGNYIVEYFRIGWNMWLKAATCRQLTTTIGDLIEGSEYKFRVKAENPYGISEPSDESDIIFIPDPKRGLLEPPARTNQQIILDEPPEKWLESRQQLLNEPLTATTTTTIADIEQLKRNNNKKILSEEIKQKKWPFFDEDEDDEVQYNLPSPVLLANQVLRKVKMAPKRGWSEDSQQSFDNDDMDVDNVGAELEIKPPIPPKRKNKPSLIKPENKQIQTKINKQTTTNETMHHHLLSTHEDELHSSSEMMIVLVPNSRAQTEERDDEIRLTAEQLERAISIAPPISLSAPVIGSNEDSSIIPITNLRATVSSTELMYELSMARMHKEMNLEEIEMNLEKKYALERRRSFEKRARTWNVKEKNINPINNKLNDKTISHENLLMINKEEDFDNNDEKLVESDKFSARFMALEKNFEEYSIKYPSDIDDIDLMRFDSGMKHVEEEETYHPRVTKGIFTPITIQIPQIRIQDQDSIDKELNLLTNNKDISDNDEDKHSDTSLNKSDSPRNSPNLEKQNLNKITTPKPILKLRERSLDRNDMKKVVRIETPPPTTEQQIEEDDILRLEDVDNININAAAGEVARNRRRLKLLPQAQRKEIHDPMTVVISHYSDIVREYGGQMKKPSTKLYLNYEELKAAAEQTEQFNEIVNVTTISEQQNDNKTNEENTNNKQLMVAKENLQIETKISRDELDKSYLYRDFILNLLLFIVACWIYIFHNPILVIPILMLMIYRQLNETLNKKLEYFWKKRE